LARFQAEKERADALASTVLELRADTSADAELAAEKSANEELHKQLAEERERKFVGTWTPETCRQVIKRTTSLVEFIEKRDGPDGGVTMPVHDVVILRDLARSAGGEVAND